LDVYGSNWAGVQPDAPAGVRGFLGLLTSRIADPSLYDPWQRVLSQTSLPGAVASPSAGARFSWSLHNLDVSHYYHYGYDGPFITLAPAFASSLATIDFAHAGLADLGPLLQAIDAGVSPFTATYVRRHHVGLDAATTWGSFAFRLDAAYDSNRVFFRRDLTGATSPTLHAVGAVEYQTGDPDKTVLLEATYIRIFQPPSGGLLVYDRDTAGVALLVRWPLWKPLAVELRAVGGVRPVMEILEPQLSAKWGSLVVSVGGLYLNGEANSFGRYFRRNSELYAKVKYSF